MRVWGSRGRDIKEGAVPLKVVVGIYAENFNTSEDGEIIKEAVIQKTGDTISYVYDISQTEGKDYEEFKITPENAVSIYPIFKAKAKELLDNKVKIVEDDGLCAPTFASTRCSGREIVINKRLKPLDKIKALISQVAICLTSDKYTTSNKEQGRIYTGYTSEASTISYAASYNLGIPFKYLQTPSIEITEEKLDSYKKKFSFMRNTMNKILNCVLESEKERLEQIEEKKELAQEYYTEISRDEGQEYTDEEAE